MAHGSTAASHKSGLLRAALVAWHALWWLLFAAAVAAFVATAVHFAPRQSATDAEVEATFAGFGLHPMDADFKSVGPSDPQARAAGVLPRSVVLAIDGRPVTATNRLLGQLRNTSSGVIRLRLAMTDGSRRDAILSRRQADNASAGPSRTFRLVVDSLVGVLAGSAGLAALGAAFLLFRRRPDELTPGLLSTSGLLFGLSTMFGSTASVALFGQVPVWIIAWAGSFAFALGLARFPRPDLPPRWAVWTAALPVVMETCLLLPSAFALNIIPILEVAFLCVIILMLAVRYRSLPPGEARQQLRWAILGQAVGTGMILVSVLLVPLAYASLDGWERLGWSFASRTFSAIGMALGWFGVLVSLLKFRLYDADAVISRSVSIGALTIALLAVFAGSEKIIELLGEEWFGERLGVLAGGIGAALAAAMLIPLHHRLSHWAEHKFQKQLIRLKLGLPLLVGDMRETAPVARIAAATLDSVTHGVRASRAALVLDGALLDARGIEAGEVERWRQGRTPPPHDGFDIDKADPLFPLRVPLAADGHGRIGWLLLGPRPDGSFYGKDERETLAEIADPVARALEIAAAREKREAEEAQRWRAQESLNAEIRSVNGELVRVLGSLDAKLALLMPLPPAEAAE